MDYYTTLGLEPSTATIDDISGAYRKLAVETHPFRVQAQGQVTQKLCSFDAICEAFEVLSNPEHKAAYDRYGYEGLRNGVPQKRSQATKVQSGYVFSGNSVDIFKSFFGSKNPFTDNFEILTLQKVERQMKNSEGLEDIIVKVGCTIREFYNGSLKNIDFVRTILMPDGKTTQSHNTELTIEVKAGYSPETVLVYKLHGNQAPAMRPSALQVRFELEEEKNSNFRINGQNLIYTHQVSLVDAIQNMPFQVRTLDKRMINVNFDQIPSPQSCHIIAGEGMPIVGGKTGEKGDLMIKFDVEFPKQIESAARQQIIDLLDE